ncbi:SrfA family protein [Atlantibacter subterraneus]|uniref:SrfA family protein n=1 Tax=Atlantibacter subterraneus TaxID=255519 RepID=UPI0029654A7D|nr:SrfA family protein [Atlantibacter subterranea]MDW2740895.1 SrfA family protein [Atlantibacter subterranea]
MAKTLLRSGNLDDFQAVGDNGQSVFDSALQIRETLRLRKQPLVDYLAIPQRNDDGDRVDWYAPLEGKATSWLAASDAQRKQARRLLESALASASALSQRCRQSDKTALAHFGALLEKALQFPAANHVWLVDGKPVVTFWGFVSINEGLRDDILACLNDVEPAPPVIETLPAEEPEVPMVKPQLSEPDAPLLMPAPEPTAMPVIAPVSEPAPQIQPAPAAPAPTRRKSVWLLPVAAAVIAAIAGPVLWTSLQNPSAPAVAAAPKAVEDKIAAVRALENPTPVVAEVKPAPVVEAPPLPLVQASISQPEPVVTPPAPAQPEDTRNAMLMDADQVKIGSTRFLNGSWRVQVESRDPITGKPPSLRYDIKNNKGSVRVTHGDNIVCRGEVFSGLHSSGELMIKTRGNARCTDGSRFPLPEITCKSGEGNVAQCTARYDQNTLLLLTFKKASA